MWDKLSMKEKADMIKVAVNNGILNLDTIRRSYNKYAEGGLKNNNSSTEDTSSLDSSKDDSLLENYLKLGTSIASELPFLNWLKAAKIAKDFIPESKLNEKDRKAQDIEHQHHLNKSITNEDVVDSYMDNVLYVMENPTNKGFKNGKYYPYADSSSPKNLGPGINYTSDIGKKLDFSGKRGYTKEELNEILRPDLLAKMADIMTDLHDMYHEDADTMSMGNRQILLDTSHNVRPRGKKRANMPKAWPNLVEGMMTGDVEKVHKNTYSGSKRRQLMKNALAFLDFIDKNTVKNR